MISFIDEPGTADFDLAAKPAGLVLSGKDSFCDPGMGYPLTMF
jgi:hypothetical protein